MSLSGAHTPQAGTNLVQGSIQAVTIISSGMFTGVMLFIGNSLGGYWQSLGAQQFLTWFATNNAFIQDTIPLVALPTLLGSFLCTFVFRRQPSRRWWLLATLCWISVAVLTFVFFVPTNSAFASRTVPAADVTATLALWLQLHWIRIILGITGTASAYLAVTRA